MKSACPWEKGATKHSDPCHIGVLDSCMRVLHLFVGCGESRGSCTGCGDPQDPEPRPTKGDVKTSSLDNVADNTSGTKVQLGPQAHKSVTSLGHAY